MGSIVLAGCSAAWCAWLAAGFSSQERSALLRDARKLYGRIEQVVGRLVGSRGGGEPVSLGQVSEMVDVIRLGLSAGLSFDAALGLYCEQGTGRLAGRMLQARLGWQMGMESREESLMAAARDLHVRQLESFASAVGQAHAFGAPLSETLAHQGTEMRAAHRAAVEREIERAPVKMLIPTGTLILPALLLSIVGPLLAASGMI